MIGPLDCLHRLYEANRQGAFLEVLLGSKERKIQLPNVYLAHVITAVSRAIGILVRQCMAKVTGIGVRMALNNGNALRHRGVKMEQSRERRRLSRDCIVGAISTYGRSGCNLFSKCFILSSVMDVGIFAHIHICSVMGQAPLCGCCHWSRNNRQSCNCGGNET